MFNVISLLNLIIILMKYALWAMGLIKALLMSSQGKSCQSLFAIQACDLSTLNKHLKPPERISSVNEK